MIKVTLGEQPKEENKKPFPKLMIIPYSLDNRFKNRGMLVLFISSGKGTVIANPENYRIGDYLECWSTDLFVDYNEPITLQNA